MIWYKIKAGALQFTMFILVVIALLLAAFIILVYTHKRFNIQTDFVLETIENANKGFYYATQNEIPLNDSISINLNDEDYKSLNVHRTYWGIFEKVITTSKIKTNSFKKVALLGALQPIKDRIALYVEDQNKPLVVVGNTKIEGVTYLPEQGVRTGNISGHSYYGSQLIYGSTQISLKFPELPKETVSQIKHVSNRLNEIDSNQFLDLKKSKSYQNSFLNLLQVIYSTNDISLDEISLTGQILVESETKITVHSSSNLKDIVLVAPEIEIKKNVKGVFQAIATKGITVGENCELKYPSALVLNEDSKNILATANSNSQEKTPSISIENGAIFQGIVLFLGTSKNYKAQVFIDEHAIVKGEVYCNKNLELLGAIHGSVFTSNFVANQSGSSYQNHLYNATISVDKLPQEYVGLILENSTKGIAKWLY